MSQPQPPLPRITGRGLLITAGGWTLYSLLFGIYFSAMFSLPVASAIAGQLTGSIPLALFGLPVWLIAVRRLDRSSWGWRVGAHAILGPLYMAAIWYLSEFLSRVLYDAPAVSPELVKWQLLGLVFTYLVQFGLFHIVRSNQKLRWREHQQVELERLLREQELALLRSQLNPHFLFNSLNTISAVLSQDAEGARRLIARLGDVLRYAVDSVDLESVALRDEWRLTRSYLDVEQARLSQRLVIHEDIPEDLLSCAVPPMILQPIVENAILHGISPNPAGGEVHIAAERHDDALQLTVNNSGPLVSGSITQWEKNGTALRNIRARLQALYGDNATFSVAAPAEGGFRATMRLPWRPA